MRVLPYGPGALLLEPDDPADVLPLAAALTEVGGVEEIAPAARTVLIRVAPASLARVRVQVAGLDLGSASSAPATADAVVLDVVYDGADLASTADELGMDTDALVRAHTDGEYVVAFCGFVPGFAYLTGLDAALHVARLPEPRTRVPSGSVGIAGEFTGVYPRSSPGGWRLLGRTDAALWELDRDPPALLVPGTQVRFRAVP